MVAISLMFAVEETNWFSYIGATKAPMVPEGNNYSSSFHGPSVITSKPAIHHHFKTGQRNYSGQEEFYRIFG